MRRILVLTLFSLTLHPAAFAYCKVLPRLICAEYANSDAVVEAKLLTKKHHIVAPNEEREDWYIYTLESTRVHKGKIDKEFRVREYNDSGRAGFFWNNGQSYLLFLHKSDDGTWWLYGCGNSVPLRKSGFALKVLESLTSRVGGLVQGVIREGNSANPAQGIAVEVRSGERSYKITTNREGKFAVHVEAGRYTVRAHRVGWSFKRDEIESYYEDPRDIQIDNGGCAQVVMIGDPKK